MLAVIIGAIALSVLAVGNVLGFLMATYHGGRAAVAYADHLIRRHGPQLFLDAQNDEESRVDALTIRNLIRAAEPIAGNEDAAKTLRLGEYTAFADALMAAHDRFADWIEWAEVAADTEDALAPAEASA